MTEVVGRGKNGNSGQLFAEVGTEMAEISGYEESGAGGDRGEENWRIFFGKRSASRQFAGFGLKKLQGCA